MKTFQFSFSHGLEVNGLPKSVRNFLKLTLKGRLYSGTPIKRAHAIRAFSLVLKFLALKVTGQKPAIFIDSYKSFDGIGAVVVDLYLSMSQDFHKSIQVKKA